MCTLLNVSLVDIRNQKMDPILDRLYSSKMQHFRGEYLQCTFIHKQVAYMIAGLEEFEGNVCMGKRERVDKILHYEVRVQIYNFLQRLFILLCNYGLSDSFLYRYSPFWNGGAPPSPVWCSCWGEGECLWECSCL